MKIRTLQRAAVRLPAPLKVAIIGLADALTLATAMLAAWLFTGALGPDAAGAALALAAAAALLGPPLFAGQGLYRAVIRFAGNRLALTVLRAVSGLAAALLLLALAVPAAGVRGAVSLALVFWAFAALGVIGGRFLMRAALNPARTAADTVAIYGAGQAGMRLAAALASGRSGHAAVFLDDQPALQGRSISGIPVQAPEQLPALIGSHGIKRVLLAMPSIPRRQRQAIIQRLERFPLHVQTIPDIGDLVSGKAHVDELKDVDAVDLLGRDPVPPDDELLGACIRGKSVMVTGAGGSIGSELCRQIIRLAPRRLLLFEISEAALYQVEQELSGMAAAEGLDVEVVALLGSVHHRERVHGILKTWRVQTVYHAAAYKHVPIVEHNMVEGVHNNIIGTWHSAEAALEAGVETFVLVSTDKAVQPVNVMGASKRMAELVLQGLARRGGPTRFCMVRFGNVLESSGSVVPLFREQIRRGGPVTVTHPEIIRYFMTIPEAAQLVLQASAMGTGGDVFVLDMGSPVRIDDLARRMVHLMGLTVRDEAHPNGDIAIEYTGLRPAEKLYEELLIGSNVTGTRHPMIMRAMEDSLSWPEVQAALDQLLEASRRFDCERIRALLLEHVEGYQPAGGVEDLAWRASRREARPATVTALDSRRGSSARTGA